MPVAQILSVVGRSAGGGPAASGVYIGSNSYVTFGSGSSEYSSLNAGNPPYPKIMISSADNSYQRIYDDVSGTAPNRIYTVRYEGTNGTGGTAGNPNIVWEVVFYENIVTQIDLHIGANLRDSAGLSGVFTASTLTGEFTNGVVNQSYRIATFSGGATVDPLTPNFLGAGAMTLRYNGTTDDGSYQTALPFPIQFNGASY